MMESNGMSKLCCSCGKELTGHTRFKDSLGYWCKDCHRTDKKRRQGIRCAGCGREFPESKLIAFQGEYHCFSCEKQRQEEIRRKLSAVAKHGRYWKAELQQLTWIALVLVVLGTIIALKHFNFL
jgi:hypothetical protein